MSSTKTPFAFDLIMVLLTLRFMIFSAWAALAALQTWFGLAWAILGLIGLALIVGGRAVPVVAIFGAIQVWDWPWWVAVPVFVPALLVLIALAPMAVLLRRLGITRD